MCVSEEEVMISLCQEFCRYWSLKAVVAWIWDYIARAKWGQNVVSMVLQ